MTTRLREWQTECLRQLHAAFDAQRDFLVTATPGAGKTTLALAFAYELVRQGKIDHIHVVAPTRPIRKHWQDAAEAWGLRLGRRSNVRLRNGSLPIDIGGVATTYSQVAQEPDAHAVSVEARLALAILDECHHSGDRRAWGEGVKEAFEGARFRLHLSGTPFRQDGNVIPFIGYGPDGVSRSDFPYRYSRAIAENVCRPVLFQSYDALVQYKHRGEKFSVTFSDDVPQKQMSEVLRFALHPEAGLIEQMVRDADDEISAKRARGARWTDAAGLLVAMNQAHAYECAKIIHSVTGEEPMVVVSDSETAEDDLLAFRDGMGRWIVAVRMISEGVDIPRLMVAVYATNVIATLFFRQFVGRVVRVRHQGMEEVAAIFLPHDERLMREAADIEAEIKQFLKDVPDSFPAVRNALAAKTRHASNVVPTVSEIEAQGQTYRGEAFSTVDLAYAESVRHLFPRGDQLAAVQIAYTLRMLDVRQPAA